MATTLEEKLGAFKELLTIMDELREKCPWDQKQTLESLRHLTIEECYELSDAIIEGDLQEIKKELGDVLLHIVFYSKIASEQSAFDIKGVIDNICQKLIKRHPHIYGDVKADTEEEVKRNWEQIKLQEGNKSVLSGVPKSLPAMVKAFRIQEKARGVGFDWELPSEAWEKVKEEMLEVEQEITNPILNQENKEKEIGDLFFALINYARLEGIEPEAALERTNKKFIQRFQYIEQKAGELGKDLANMDLSEMDKFWNEAKQFE